MDRKIPPCKCGCLDFKVKTEGVKPPHAAEARCARCNSYLCFLPKPESDRVRRPAAHRDLVKRFGRGFCELCMRKEVDLPAGTFLLGHHVVEYQDEGEPKRENVWILCSFCSAIVHSMRTYLGHYRKREEPEAIDGILDRVMALRKPEGDDQ